MLGTKEDIRSLLGSEGDLSFKFFEDFIVLNEGEDEVYIGRTLLNRFIIVPKIAGHVVEELRNGKTLRVVKSDLNAQEQEIDLKGFISNLISLNFVEKIGEIVIPSEERVGKWESSSKAVQKMWVKWIFSIPTVIAYLAILSVVMILFISGEARMAPPTFTEIIGHSSLIAIILFGLIYKQ